MSFGNQGKTLTTMASKGELNIALRQRISLGTLVNPASNTNTPTITTPLTIPKTAPRPLSSQLNPMVLNSCDKAIESKLQTSKAAKNRITNAAKNLNDSLGMLDGSNSANCKVYVLAI